MLHPSRACISHFLTFWLLMEKILCYSLSHNSPAAAALPPGCPPGAGPRRHNATLSHFEREPFILNEIQTHYLAPASDHVHRDLRPDSPSTCGITFVRRL